MAITKVELQSSFVKEGLESQEHKQKIKALEDWFTSAQTAAQTQYQATAQQAAAQASYDISGAYANYLKQQRSVAAAGQLESGYKQELGDITQSQFQSAYGQAKATEAQTIMGAAQTAQKDIAEAASQYSKYTETLQENLINEAKLKANIYKAAEEYGNFGDKLAETKYGAAVYDESGAEIGRGKGIYSQGVLTEYGSSQFQKLLLQDEGFKQYLEEEGLEEELEYYLSKPAALHEELFGFNEDFYDYKSASSARARLSLGDTFVVETANRAKETTGGRFINSDSFNYFKQQYALSDDDVLKALNQVTGKTDKTIKDALKTIGQSGATGMENYPKNPELYFSRLFAEYAKTKHSKE